MKKHTFRQRPQKVFQGKGKNIASVTTEAFTTLLSVVYTKTRLTEVNIVTDQTDWKNGKFVIIVIIFFYIFGKVCDWIQMQNVPICLAAKALSSLYV